MKVHELKTWPESFEALWYDMKTADFRRNDRGFAAGDVLRLVEWDPKEHAECAPQGCGGGRGEPGDTEDCYGVTCRTITAEVTHVQPGGTFGIPEDHCMLSLRVTEKSE